MDYHAEWTVVLMIKSDDLFPDNWIYIHFNLEGESRVVSRRQRVTRNGARSRYRLQA
jgi:hypothetical protein